MNYDISYIFIINSLFIAVLMYFSTKGVTLFLTVITGVVLGLFTLYIYNSLHRKEILNIIKDNNTLYFHLSDDYLFSINISQEDNLSDILVETIRSEMATIKLMVNKIYFINFKDDRLEQKLNALIEDESF